MEGRYRITVDVAKDGDEYVATWNNHGINVEVRDVSAITAANQASQQALDKLKSATTFDQIYG